MKKICYVFMLMLAIKNSDCQITYPATDYAVAGDTFRVSKANPDSLQNYNFQSGGANVNWNFSQLDAQSQYIDQYLSPNNTGYRLGFITSCIAGGGGTVACTNEWNSLSNLAHLSPDSLVFGPFSFSNAVDFYEKNTSVLADNIIGMSFGLNNITYPVTETYTRPDTVYHFPLVYGNTDSCNSAYAINLSNIGLNFDYKVNSKRVNVVTGWGALTTPYGYFASTLKLQTTVYSFDTMIYNNSVVVIPSDTVITYSWFTPQKARPVLVATAQIINGAIHYTGVEYIDTIRCLQPVALFNYSPLVPYISTTTHNVSVSFNNTSNNANVFNWNFGDPGSGASNTSTATNAAHTFDSAGIYHITLISCNSACSPQKCDTLTIPVAIFDSTKVQAGFTWLPLEPCTNDSVRFTNTSLNAGTYTWNFGDGSTSTAKNPVKVYSTAGNYPVLLIATGSSGKDSLAQTITVQAAPAATITAGGATTFCQGGSVTLTASAGASYNWSNVQTTQAITASNAANYTVTVTGSDGCSAASSPKTVTVNALPTAKITASGALTFCLGDSVTLTATAGTGYKYKWSSKQTAQSIEVAASGSYKVTVTTASGCSAVSSAEKVTTEKLPTATITANGPVTFCTGSVKLTANSGSGYSYKWSNGATAKAITVSAAGEYIVTVTNKTDCSFASSPEVVTINCGNEAQTLADKSDINANQNTLTSTGNTEFLASVYPNPYIGVFRLKLQSASMDNLNIKIFDVNGRVLEERINIAFENDITLGEGYASGFYMVQIEQGSVTKYLPVVKSE